MIHAENLVQAFQKGLTADYEGAHPLFVTQAQNIAGVDSAALLQLFYPDVSEEYQRIKDLDSSRIGSSTPN